MISFWDTMSFCCHGQRLLQRGQTRLFSRHYSAMTPYISAWLGPNHSELTNIMLVMSQTGRYRSGMLQSQQAVWPESMMASNAVYAINWEKERDIHSAAISTPRLPTPRIRLGIKKVKNSRIHLPIISIFNHHNKRHHLSHHHCTPPLLSSSPPLPTPLFQI